MSHESTLRRIEVFVAYDFRLSRWSPTTPSHPQSSSNQCSRPTRRPAAATHEGQAQHGVFAIQSKDATVAAGRLPVRLFAGPLV